MKVSKQAKEAQLQQIFRMLLENKTQEEIAHELNIAVKTVQRYTMDIDKRYGEMQSKKTDNTLFMECQLFKNRMLRLYKILEKKAEDPKVSGTETAKCCEVAANIAIDVIKAESEGIRAIKELGLGTYGKGNRLLNSIQQEDRIRDSNDVQQQSQSTTTAADTNINRKF